MKLDDKIVDILEADYVFEPVFTRGQEKLYFGYNNKQKATGFLISVSSLAADANARNKTFLDIIKQ